MKKETINGPALKIEMVKETKVNGEIWYSIEVNGKYLDNTNTQEYAMCKKKFDSLTVFEAKKEIIFSKQF